jgi:hypothetical protein
VKRRRSIIKEEEQQEEDDMGRPRITYKGRQVKVVIDSVSGERQ